MSCVQEGYGVNTFAFINDQGAEKLVKFHWRPTIGELRAVQAGGRFESSLEFAAMRFVAPGLSCGCVSCQPCRCECSR